MLFNSSGFIFLFLPLVLAISLRLKGQWLLGWISLTSYIFYALFGHLWFLAPMMVTTLLDFYLAPYIHSARTPGRKKLYLLISLCGNLGLLIYFKYAGLLLKTGEYLLNTLGSSPASLPWMAVFSVVLPAGISFYTFQTLSYVIDVYRGQALPEKKLP